MPLDCPDCGLGYNDIHDRRCPRYATALNSITPNPRLNDNDRKLILEIANDLEQLTYSMGARQAMRDRVLPKLVDLAGIPLLGTTGMTTSASQTYAWDLSAVPSVPSPESADKNPTFAGRHFLMQSTESYTIHDIKHFLDEHTTFAHLIQDAILRQYNRLRREVAPPLIRWRLVTATDPLDIDFAAFWLLPPPASSIDGKYALNSRRLDANLFGMLCTARALYEMSYDTLIHRNFGSYIHVLRKRMYAIHTIVREDSTIGFDDAVEILTTIYSSLENDPCRA